MKASEFPAFFSTLKDSLSASGDLPDALRRDLTAAVLQADRTLLPDHDPSAKISAGSRWVFQRDFLTECAANTPVFVGIWYRPKQGGAEFFASRVTRSHAEAWIPQGADQFRAVGSLTDSGLQPDSDAPYGVHAVFAPAGELADRARQAYWQRRGRELGLTLLPYPAFWPVNRR